MPHQHCQEQLPKLKKNAESKQRDIWWIRKIWFRLAKQWKNQPISMTHAVKKSNDIEKVSEEPPLAANTRKPPERWNLYETRESKKPDLICCIRPLDYYIWKDGVNCLRLVRFCTSNRRDKM